MLLELHREIDSRTHEIASAHVTWPCRRGCDHCCRNLAELPRLTRAEWHFLEQGLARLPQDIQREIAARLQSPEPRVCPFLDRTAGSCLIYEHRPVACRTYGFYVERDRGLYCRMIEERVNSGEFACVVWGNAAGVEARLEARLEGEPIALADWFNDCLNDSPEWSPRPLPTPPSASPNPCDAR
jgi:Fe-S-cluster containining protein